MSPAAVREIAEEAGMVVDAICEKELLGMAFPGLNDAEDP